MFYTLIEHSPTLDITINTQLWLSCRCCIRTIREHIRLYIFGFIVYINNKNINIKKVTQCDKRTVTCDKNRADVMLVLLHMTMELSNLRKKNKVTTICDKRTVKCDTGTVECDNRTVKYEKKKKKRKPLNVTKESSHVMLELHNVRMKLSNVRKELSHVMLELHNVKMEPSNVRKK